ncbi:hypothetical protein NPX13_g7194 [Xylaria arbuscula]|uniref:Uncharacterized protein n=1 Tax=Xylaria arbuscula TaxID=114810 RepID=A0A9W8NB49_9PEZI|nr:hypothetical protein NPX13_g7194 [Xylaria arbuscula]
MPSSLKAAAKLASQKASITPGSGKEEGQYLAVIPHYNVAADEEAVPIYTRKYVAELTEAVRTRLYLLDNDADFCTGNWERARKMHVMVFYLLASVGIMMICIIMLLLNLVTMRY